jgi:small-conductance mechanosensitive channel
MQQSQNVIREKSMLQSQIKSYAILTLMLIAILLGTTTICVQNTQASDAQKNGEEFSKKNVQVPEDLNNDQIHVFLATLSDAQVRRLLLEELKEKAERELSEENTTEEPGGLTGFIRNIRFIANDIQWRIHYLKSGAGVDPDELPHLYKLLGKREEQGKVDPFKTIMGVVGLFVVSLVILWFIHRFAAPSYQHIEKATSVNMKARIGGLVLQALLDFLFMLVFAAVTLTLFFIFMDRTGPQRVLVATYLAGFLIVMVVQLLLRFFLAYKVPALRFLSMDDQTAVYLHRWLTVIAVVLTFGWLTCGLFRVAGASEANHLIMVSLVGMVAISMIIIMIVQKRKQVQQALAGNLPETGFRAFLARIWHHLAIIALLFLWLLSTFNQFLGGIRPGAPGIQTLLLIPLYILLDWVLREILRIAFGIAARPEDVNHTLAFKKSKDSDPEAETTAEMTSDRKESIAIDDAGEEDTQSEETSTEPEEKVIGKHLDVRRLNRIIGGGLRIVLALFIFLYLLEIWGFDIEFGITITKAASHILIVVLICYVLWEVISALIQRKLAEEMPETDEDMEEGGAGGSRLGTLLLLLRKFMLAVIIVMATLIMLSSIGVNIGPLIAGAGVIGLAIGFGAQTLVKDIIAGVFFLIDDAFRVGDYIQTAGTKGMVEHISLRSLRLRHPRGMVNTIPFGDIGIVTNMSRDYIITKLDFRVRYDTDVEKVRKIIKKKVYKPIMKNPDLAPKLLDKIKSQGVREMDDSAMIMRVKYKTAPGEQFVIRKEVYRLMQEAFSEEGIEFAHRNVTVYMPPELPETGSDAAAEGEPGNKDEKDKKVREAAAAAALAAAAADEEAAKPKK